LNGHIQSNVDTYLCKHPEALVMVTGDFNHPSTGLKENRILKKTIWFAPNY
jgi:hypothetical protein